MDVIGNKFFKDNREKWEAVNPPSLFESYSNDRYLGRIKHPESLSLLYSISLFTLNFFGNLHNRILASGQQGHFKLVEVILLGMASTIIVPIIALAESVVRLISAASIYNYYKFLSDEEPQRHSFPYKIWVGGYVWAICILEGARSGYFMISHPEPYFAYNRIDDWAFAN